MDTCCVDEAGLYFGDQNFLGGRRRLLDVSYADDLLFPVAGEALKIMELVAKAASIAWETYHAAGFQLNWGPKKSAVKISWSGPGAKLARKKCEQLADLAIKVRFGNRTASLPVV